MTVSDLIKDAMMEIGVLAIGETPTAENEKSVLARFNSLLGRWGTKSVLIPCSASENFALVAGTGQYSMGTAGTASSIRAEKILDTAFIRDSSNIDHKVTVISEAEYNEIGNKTIQARPYKLFYDPRYPIGYIDFYPVPSAIETAYIESVKPLSEVAQANVTDDFNLPRIYEEAVRTNLAVRIAPMFGRSVTPELAVLADGSYDDLLSLNAGNRSRRNVKMGAGLPGVTGTRYDINSG